MSFNSLYYVAEGLAFSRGVDSFCDLMPRERALKLYKANLELKGFSWVDRYFASWIVSVAGKEAKISAPVCVKDCPYRMKYDDNIPLQKNALRIEMMDPADRCGFRLKSNRIGGRPDDYHPCTFKNT